MHNEMPYKTRVPSNPGLPWEKLRSGVFASNFCSPKIHHYYDVWKGLTVPQLLMSID